ncbi:DUF3618 domain-containing protein [Streptomyces ipomoeae]|nr:DUF3618 domain-containing protein [Streptomyces ipomoeae]MDX2931119.1 DUF3618 domain-containing protein [Streptomyces ipomoeae]TQE14556.1 DUF3618 domain-containing protein [Streptomyces ipomoeae]
MGASGGPKEWVGAKGPDELRRQIEMTRSRLGDTVEELAAKADVKGRARARMHSVQERVPRQAIVVGGAGVAVVAAGVFAWRHYYHDVAVRAAPPLMRRAAPPLMRRAAPPLVRLRDRLSATH